VIWQAANLYAVLGDRDATTAELCVVLEHDHARASDAASLALRMSPDSTVLACDPRKPAQ
jgi:hypothetical protein